MAALHFALQSSINIRSGVETSSTQQKICMISITKHLLHGCRTGLDDALLCTHWCVVFAFLLLVKLPQVIKKDASSVPAFPFKSLIKLQSCKKNKVSGLGGKTPKTLTMSLNWFLCGKPWMNGKKKQRLLYTFSPAVWYNLSPLWDTIDNPGCYIRYIRALCYESNHSNELQWSHSTVGGINSRISGQVNAAISSFINLCSVCLALLLRCCITEEVLTANRARAGSIVRANSCMSA